MTRLKCDACGFVGHESEWDVFRGHQRYECPECQAGRGDAYKVDD